MTKKTFKCQSGDQDTLKVEPTREKGGNFLVIRAGGGGMECVSLTAKQTRRLIKVLKQTLKGD